MPKRPDPALLLEELEELAVTRWEDFEGLKAALELGLSRFGFALGGRAGIHYVVVLELGPVKRLPGTLPGKEEPWGALVLPMEKVLSSDVYGVADLILRYECFDNLQAWCYRGDAGRMVRDHLKAVSRAGEMNPFSVLCEIVSGKIVADPNLGLPPELFGRVKRAWDRVVEWAARVAYATKGREELLKEGDEVLRKFVHAAADAASRTRDEEKPLVKVFKRYDVCGRLRELLKRLRV